MAHHANSHRRFARFGFVVLLGLAGCDPGHPGAEAEHAASLKLDTGGFDPSGSDVDRSARIPDGSPVRAIQAMKETMRASGTGVMSGRAGEEPVATFDARPAGSRHMLKEPNATTRLPHPQPNEARSKPLPVSVATERGTDMRHLVAMQRDFGDSTVFRVQPEGGPGGLGGVVAQTDDYTIAWFETPTGPVTMGGAAHSKLEVIETVGTESCGATPSTHEVEEQDAEDQSRAYFAGGSPEGEVDPIDVLFLFENGTCSGTNCKALVRLQNVFGGAATFPPLAGVAAATIQDAFLRSGTHASIRVVGVQALPFSVTNDACVAQQNLNQNVGADVAARAAIDTARDAAGADVVVVWVGNPGTWGGCAALPREPSSLRSEDSFITVIDAGAGPLVYPHEFGHLLGAGHDRSLLTQGQRPNLWENASPAGESYAFGHIQCVTSGGTVTGHRSIMVTTNSAECAASTWPQYNVYSNPYLYFPGTAIPGGTLSPPNPPNNVPFTVPDTGATLTVAERNLISNRDSNVARRIRETSGAVAAYRIAPSFGVAGEITSPTPGATLSSSQTFTWSAATPAPGVTAVYVLEIGAADAAFPTLFPATTSTSMTVTVPSPPGTTEAAYVRLWSMVDTDKWTWSEFRYNTDGIVRGCVEDPEAASMWPEMVQYSCESGGQPVCDYDGVAGEVTCRLDNATGSAVPVLFAIANPTGSARHYDLALMGQDRAPGGFCCLISDASNLIDKVYIAGSPVTDQISLSDFGYDMEPFTSSSGLTCLVEGKDGGDLIHGSTSTDSDYLDDLRGWNNGDVIFGHEGGDLILGGQGNDYLYGDDGFDTLIGKNGSDELHGGTGWDTLCEINKADLMVGSPSWTSADWNVLYYAKSSDGSFNASTTVNSDFHLCGHKDFTASWGDCDTAAKILENPPGECGVDNRMPD